MRVPPIYRIKKINAKEGAVNLGIVTTYWLPMFILPSILIKD